jgi:sugar lactone lactonase YvrE
LSADPSFATYVIGYQDLDVGGALNWTITGLTNNTTYYYRVRATNSLGTGANSNVTSATTVTATAPAITSANNTIFTAGVAGSFTVTASGSPPPFFSATGLPSWAAFDSDAGLLSGTPPAGAAGTQMAISITASNGAVPDATQAFTLAVQALPSIAAPLSISTVAGVAGTRGTSDGVSPHFNLPTGVSVDGAGNIYVADTGNETIRRVTAAGVAVTLAGRAGSSGSINGTGTAATFNSPSGIAVDSGGNVYVADTLNHVIRKVTSAGLVSTVAGQASASGSADGSGSSARFFAPQGLALDSARSLLYVADTNNDAIRKIDLSSSAVTTIAGFSGQPGSIDGVGSAARFNGPSAVALDKNGNLYVADTDNNTIRTLSTDGTVGTLAGLAGSSGAADGTAGAARFNHPAALAVDGAFNVYVLDTDNHTLRKIVSAAGVVTTIAGHAGAPGSADGVGADARFNFPAGLAITAASELYIADTNNHTLRLGLLPNLPVISLQPQSTSASVGGTVQFSVGAAGRPAVTYQWYANGLPINGATGISLTVTGVKASDAGDYTVVVANIMGSVTSNPATLIVNEPAQAPVGLPGGGGGAPSTWFCLALALLGAARWAVSRRTHRANV